MSNSCSNLKVEFLSINSIVLLLVVLKAFNFINIDWVTFASIIASIYLFPIIIFLLFIFISTIFSLIAFLILAIVIAINKIQDWLN